MTAELIKEGEREVEREMRKELARKRKEREEREQREAAGLDLDEGSGSEHDETVEEGNGISLLRVRSMLESERSLYSVMVEFRRLIDGI